MRSAAMLLPLVACAAGVDSSASKWAPLDALIKGWAFTDDFVVTIGVMQKDGSVKREYVHQHGKMTLDTQIGTGSTSKWPMAMMVTGAVADGSIGSLNDPVNKYLDYWTKDPADNRSYVELKHLLSFTSGFGGGHPGDEVQATRAMARQALRREDVRGDFPADPVPCMDKSDADFEECARSIYEIIGGPGGRNMSGRPGTVYAYNSYHLQLAAAVVCAATNLTIQQVFHKYLFTPYGMKSSYCNGTNPVLAGCMVTTPGDYDRFLAATLGRTVLPKSLVDASEQDYTPFLTPYPTLYGNYAFGHFLSCFDNPHGFTQACKEAHVHADPGAFGFYPTMDRKYKYYMQVAAFEAGNITYGRSGIPEYLAQLIKPISDSIVAGDKMVPLESQHSTPAYRALAFIDVNYIAQCYLQPLSCI
eukprot:Hpha_TRINITY_DN16648_c3_g5::TRINITY_DN16648_c3_g5_i1::g.183416::m.183416